jgi:pyruvate dehydrogenase (quinone)
LFVLCGRCNPPNSRTVLPAAYQARRDQPLDAPTRACGGHGFTAKQPDDLKTALTKAFAVNGPAIVDAFVAADEMPNLPHVEPNMIGNYALAKIKEAVLSVTG